MTMESSNNNREFVESWLMEMPEGLGEVGGLWERLDRTIEHYRMGGWKPVKVKPGLYKIIDGQTRLYWYGTPTRVDLAVWLQRKPQSLVVHMSGINPKLRGKAPYASDLYAAVLDDNDASVLMSDTQLSDQGLRLWKRMIEMGYAVTVYDEYNPGRTRKTFTKPQQLMRYFEDGEAEFERYRYVLSKPGQNLEECISFFNLRRYRELAGLDSIG